MPRLKLEEQRQMIQNMPYEPPKINFGLNTSRRSSGSGTVPRYTGAIEQDVNLGSKAIREERSSHLRNLRNKIYEHGSNVEKIVHPQAQPAEPDQLSDQKLMDEIRRRINLNEDLKKSIVNLCFGEAGVLVTQKTH